MLVIAAELRVGAGSMDKLCDAGAVMSEKSTAEDGCHLYACSKDLNEDNLMRITEQWESQAALDAHFATPHMADFQATMGSLEVVSVKATKYQVSDIEDMLG